MSDHEQRVNPSCQARDETLQHLQPGPGSWQPQVGSEVLDLSLPAEGRRMVVQEALNILSRCVSPLEHEGRETGLVVGYVQSGKTMSFTTVAALARDNGYRMVIVIAGTSQYLRDQSRQRVIKDLRLASTSEWCLWRHIPDPNTAQNSHNIIRDILDEWNDTTVPPQERRTVLITVMKHHQHLQNLIDVLTRVDLQGVPTVIIDDEGDQAGLNTMVRQGDQSTTYRCLLALKNVIPHHSFLQYTATPQAPLLINIVDVLSPGFAEVITPGSDYIGGQEFFGEAASLVRIIPANEIPTQHNHIAHAPPSLLQAMRLFFVGTAVHLVRQDKPPHRSMMVHPSRLTDRHGEYLAWVMRAREGWMDILQQPEHDPDRVDLMRLFRQAYIDVQATVDHLPSFDDLITRFLHVMRRTTVRPLNSRPEGKMAVNWSENPYWILVGGQSMDRGFTVEGLTVTYMPRGPGVGNADTVQQRARFFGYKRAYMGYCRIFLEQDVNDALRAYIEHEEDIRTQLIEHRRTGHPMSEWKRQFFLTRNLRPTRQNVLDIDYRRINISDEWVYPEGPHDTPDAIEANRQVFREFLESLRLATHNGLDRRHGEHKNLVAENVPLSSVHEEFLTRINVRRLEDSRKFSALLRLIQVHLAQHPDDTCAVFLIAGGHRIRRGYENDRIKQLFQGAQYDTQGMTYPGDREIKVAGHISLQLRYLTLGELNQPAVAENVPHVAVWVPGQMARDTVLQPQGG
jgi:hypothetical protein